MVTSQQEEKGWTLPVSKLLADLCSYFSFSIEDKKRAKASLG